MRLHRYGIDYPVRAVLYSWQLDNALSQGGTLPVPFAQVLSHTRCFAYLPHADNALLECDVKSSTPCSRSQHDCGPGRELLACLPDLDVLAARDVRVTLCLSPRRDRVDIHICQLCCLIMLCGAYNNAQRSNSTSISVLPVFFSSISQQSNGARASDWLVIASPLLRSCHPEVVEASARTFRRRGHHRPGGHPAA